VSPDTAAEHTAPEATRLALRDSLRRITGQSLAEVRITRVRWQDGLHWVALALTVDRRHPFWHREVPLSDGSQHREIGLLLRGAFPLADWNVAQDYNVETGVLREHIPPVPECLRGEQR
jgi:hypothetical protein